MLRKVHELNLDEYVNCVIASGEDNFEEYCQVNNIDYDDACEYDWNW